MSAEKLKEIKPDAGIIIIERSQFGPGHAGQWAYNIIVNGAKCEAYMDDDTKCGEISVGTVDVDIRADLDLFPFCTEEHARLIKSQLVEEIERNDGHTTPSRNGFGRA